MLLSMLEDTTPHVVFEVSSGVQFYIISLYYYIIKESLSQSIASMIFVLSCEKKIPNKSYKRALKDVVGGLLCRFFFICQNQ